ncbi:MAG TPA: OmpA family protein [Bacteroidia bacterium]|jgi:chemotaxis protein MotB|nr:OmpA family protein [Bacteroidia bacterium]
MKKIIIVSVITLLIASCVPQRIMDETKAKADACDKELTALKKSCAENEAKLAELKVQSEKDAKSLSGLQRDSAITGASYRNLTAKYDKLNALNEQLMNRLDKLIAGNEKDNAKLSSDLQLTQDQLLKKQDELKGLELRLNKQQQDLDALSAELKKREARVNELEDILKKKDQAAADLKKKLSDALFSFENKGLTITQKNGKVYVSMDESLLFASGKTAVEPKGIEALKNLAKVLEQNPDINVMVEGHTDDVPMKGSGEIKDNWDLSVMRATSVTKIILAGTSIDGKRITSAGRGEFFPLDTGKTADARKKNRRTEIILTPKLDELLKVLDSN